jgi:peptidylprolyl isomerase
LGRENRRARREREHRKQPEVAPLGQIEFPGIMGWMQRNARWMFLIGITFMILSVGAGAFATGFGSPDPVVEPEPTATAVPDEDEEATPAEPEEVINRTYEAPPETVIEEGVDYRAVLHLEGGTVVIDLLEEAAPGYVNNFVFLARNQFFDGLTFHRVIPGFVAQAGDPLGTGTGGPGYLLPEETNDLSFERGVLSMAKSPAGVSGSQFFITLGPTPHLQDDFTVFGRVVEGFELLEALTARDPSVAGQPRGDVIERIEIIEE